MPVITNPDWVDPIEETFDTGKAIRSEQGLLLAGNPIAARLGKTGAPYEQGIWHPYNGANIGDGNTGRLWSFAVDGAVAAIETPNMLDGFEYQLLAFGVSHADNVASQSFQYQLRRVSDAGLTTATLIGASQPGSANISFGIELHQPRRSMRYHLLTSANGAYESVDIGDTTKVRNVRLTVTGPTNFDAGEVYLYRRRVYA